MYCTKCGKSLPDVAKFCDSCGGVAAEGVGTSVPTIDIKRPKREFTMFKNAPVATKGQNKLLSVLLAFTLIITVVLTIAHGSLYNFITAINFNKVASVLDVDEILSFGSYNSNIIDALTDKNVKKELQKIINKGLDAIISGNIRDVMSERELLKLAKKNVELLEDASGYNFSTYNLEYFVEEIYFIQNEAVKELSRELNREAPFVPFLLSPGLRALFVILDWALILALLFLNRRDVKKAVSCIAVPVIIKGSLSLVLFFLKPLWVSIIVEVIGWQAKEFLWVEDLISICFSGYAKTSITLAVWCLILGIVGRLVVKIAKQKQIPAE